MNMTELRGLRNEAKEIKDSAKKERPLTETMIYVRDKLPELEQCLTDEERKSLSPDQKAFLVVWLEDTTVPMKAIAAQLGIPYYTIVTWRTRNTRGFKDTMESHLADKWMEAKYTASETMFSLMRSGDFRATKYVLDYSGYAPTQKIDAKVGTDIQINIVDEEQTNPNA